MGVRYANAVVQSTPINLGTGSPQQYGTLLSEYDVTEYWDLRNTPSSSAMRAYIVNVRQRITIPNSAPPAFGGEGPAAYPNYPVLVVQGIVPSTSAQNVQFYIEDYSPKTLNASVSTSQNRGTDSNAASSIQHTAGSSTSVTNSYEVSASVGFFGPDPTGGVSAGYGYSTTDTEESSLSLGGSLARGANAGTASSMSVKDWGSYAYLDVNKQQPSWIWGQEYPWNVINFNAVNDGNVALPGYVEMLLCDNSFLYPPSQLAQFGLNFVAHARWVFYVDGDAGPTDEQVAFTHNMCFWQASHGSAGAAGSLTVSAQMIPIAPNPEKIDAVTLNLPLLALRPIEDVGSGNGAVVGFLKSEFITPPSGTGPFRLKSSANNLYVTQGTGFGALSDDDAVLTAQSITAAAPASFALQFKIADPDIELSLYLKHWKTSPADCTIKLEINGQQIVRHVDSLNAASGSDNITTITLRSRDYTSQDFYDYLTMGLNTVVVTITPGDNASTCDYALRALALQ